jgi:predicted ATPase
MLRFGPHGQARGCCANDQYRHRRATINRCKSVDSVYLSFLALGYAKLSQLAEAWRCVDEALTEIRTSKEKWFEAELNRVAGEIALMASKPETLKAQAYLERALTVARDQQAKSWELRAALSMARLWRDQGKRNEARDLLTAVHGWFSEGFETLDLRQANDLPNTLRA